MFTEPIGGQGLQSPPATAHRLCDVFPSHWRNHQPLAESPKFCIQAALHRSAHGGEERRSNVGDSAAWCYKVFRRQHCSESKPQHGQIGRGVGSASLASIRQRWHAEMLVLSSRIMCRCALPNMSGSPVMIATVYRNLYSGAGDFCSPSQLADKSSQPGFSGRQKLTGGAFNEYGSEGPKAPDILDYNSRAIWNAWMQNCSIASASCIALFDYHDVIDTLSVDEACEVGVALDYVNDDVNAVPSILCSFGWHHSLETFDETTEWHPFICSMDGYVFTDERESKWQRLRVYRDPRMPHAQHTIRVNGNKADVARLLCMPSMLFEDKEWPVTQHEEAYPGNRGIVVKRGRKHSHPRLDGFTYCNDPFTWPKLVTQFGVEFGGLQTH